MSEMIEIKAELLKWCPYGFNFKLNSDDVKLTCVAEYGFICTDSYFLNYNCTFSTPSKITVNAKEYEKAVIDKCIEFCDFVIDQIVKHKKGTVIAIGHDNNSNYTRVVPIKANPRPWSESYTIEIVEGE